MTAEPFSIEFADGLKTELPESSRIAQWLHAGMEEATGEVALRVVGIEEMVALNSQFREKAVPTNVLSFPATFADSVALFDDLPLTVPEGESMQDLLTGHFLGDIAICAEVVAEESKQQQKLIEAHWAHMVIHGVLHLRGFDHQCEKDAVEMEEKETTILTSLGFADPWLVSTIDDSGVATGATQENRHE